MENSFFMPEIEKIKEWRKCKINLRLRPHTLVAQGLIH
jgi:hypothetical protein